MKKKVTMRDIGAALGVSTVTISKALGGREGVSDAVREKILRTAEEMGYQYQTPTQLEKDTDDKTYLVGILTPERFFDSTSFYASLYRELTTKMIEASMLGIFEIIPEADEASLKLPAVIAANRADALILIGQFSAAYLDCLAETQIPIILLDFYNENCDFDAIVSDGQSGGYHMTRKLQELGHREIAFVGSLERSSSIMDRYSGYLRAMILADLEVWPSLLIPDTDENHRYYEEIPLPEKLPTAFVCNNDALAMTLINQLKRKNIRVPEDVSVTGFDDYPVNTENRITTYHVDQERMALSTVRQLHHRIINGSEGSIRLVVGGWTVEGTTVAPPPNHSHS